MGYRALRAPSCQGLDFSGSRPERGKSIQYRYTGGRIRPLAKNMPLLSGGGAFASMRAGGRLFGGLRAGRLSEGRTNV